MSVFAPDAAVDCDPAQRAMLERQAQAWITGDFGPAAADWHPEGALTAPGARVPLAGLAEAIAAFHRDFRDLEVTITGAFATAAGDRIALEWLWTVTRRADGARSTTADAILVDLVDGRILSWREYFDTAGAVETHHSPPPETGA